MENIFFDNWESIGRTFSVGLLAYFSLIAMLRISGKRTPSQMKEFDFIVTVALGSTLATRLTKQGCRAGRRGARPRYLDFFTLHPGLLIS